jgi:hypothetical protein
MTTDERINIIETISDIFLDISKYFNIEYELGYDYYVNIESDYNKLIDIIRNFKESDPAKFRITSKNSVKTDWDNKKKQSYLKRTTKYLLDAVPNCESRINEFLSKYDCKYRGCVIVGIDKIGLVIIPLLENDIIRLREADRRYTSYEKNFEDINKYDQIGHANFYIKISDKSNLNLVKKKIKRFRFF